MYCCYLWPLDKLIAERDGSMVGQIFLLFSLKERFRKSAIMTELSSFFIFLKEILNFNYSCVLLKKSFNNQDDFIVNIIHHNGFKHELVYVIDKKRETFDKSHIELLKKSHLHRIAI